MEAFDPTPGGSWTIGDVNYFAAEPAHSGMPARAPIAARRRPGGPPVAAR